MKETYLKHKTFWKQRQFVATVFASFAMLTIANIINYYAGTYATERASNSVTDLILNNIPVFDVDHLFVYGTFIFWAILIGVWIYHIDRLPFSVKALSLFIVIRSLFIVLTHIGPFADQVVWSSSILSKWSFGGDLFFSGHTGIPFLFALIFWDIKLLRIFFICSSIFFATIVLLGHLHYSIDVLSAFFITYSIYHLARLLFKKEFVLFKGKVVAI